MLDCRRHHGFYHRSCFLLVLGLVSVSSVDGRQTVYWKKDHVYSSPGGSRVGTATPIPSDQAAPSTPGNPGYTALTSTTATLSWTTSTDSGGSGLAGYKIYRNLLPVATTTNTSFADSHLQPGTAYTYTIRAFDNDQNHSGSSAAVNFTTPSADTAAPSTPSDLTAALNDGVILTWQASFDLGGSGLAGYRIRRDGNLIGTVSDPTLTYTDHTAVLGNTYVYTIAAYDNASNESPLSAGVNVSYSGLYAGLVSFWELEESTATRADQHGDNDLTDNNTVTQGPGRAGNGGQFAAAQSEHLSRPDNASLSTGDIDFAVAAWVYLDSTSGERGIVSKSIANNNIEWVLRLTGGKFNFKIYNNPNTQQVTANTFGTVSTSTWYFIAAYHDSINDEIGISVNGGPFDTFGTTIAPLDTTATFEIGRLEGLNDRTWNGRIDQIGFWKRMLSSTEIAYLYNGSFGRHYDSLGGQSVDLTDGLISLWELDESSGVRVDQHGANDLSDNNTVGQAAGKLSSAGQFVATQSEYLSHADNASLSTGDIDFTVSGWVYLDSTSGERGIASKSIGNTNIEWVLRLTGGKLNFKIYNNPNTDQVTANTFGALSTGTWYFVVAFHDSSSNEIGISVNDGPFDKLNTTLAPADTTSAFEIGRLEGLNDRTWNGRIDQVGFWKRILSPAEIEYLYSNGSGRNYSGF